MAHPPWHSLNNTQDRGCSCPSSRDHVSNPYLQVKRLSFEQPHGSGRDHHSLQASHSSISSLLLPRVHSSGWLLEQEEKVWSGPSLSFLHAPSALFLLSLPWTRASLDTLSRPALQASTSAALLTNLPANPSQPNFSLLHDILVKRAGAEPGCITTQLHEYRQLN